MNDHPTLQPVPHTLQTFDVYRMPVRFEEDKTRSRNHYVACIIVDTDNDGGVAVKLTSNPSRHAVDVVTEVVRRRREAREHQAAVVLNPDEG